MIRRPDPAPLLPYDSPVSPGQTWFGFAGWSFCCAIAAVGVVVFSAVVLEDMLVEAFGDFRTGEAASILFAATVGGALSLGALVAGFLSVRRFGRGGGPAMPAIFGLVVGSFVLIFSVAAIAT